MCGKRLEMKWHYEDNMNKRKIRKGFTLIELSLSIAFIAVLSLAVVLIIANSISAYHRGLVLNQINTVGMEVVDEMRTTIQNGPVISLESMCESIYGNNSSGDDSNKLNECRNSDGGSLVSARKISKVSLDENNLSGTERDNVPIYGVFCTGNYSFVWNSGYFYNEESWVDSDKVGLKYRIKYEDDSNSEIKEEINSNIRLLKIKDENRAVCAEFNPEKNLIDITGEKFSAVLDEAPVEMLSENGNLALYDLYSPVPAANATNNNMYYSISFVLGTLQGGADVKKSGNFCATPVTPEEDGTGGIENFDYCAINKFNFAAEATGGKL